MHSVAFVGIGFEPSVFGVREVGLRVKIQQGHVEKAVDVGAERELLALDFLRLDLGGRFPLLFEG